MSSALFSLARDTFGTRLTEAAAIDLLAAHRVVVVGEIHSVPVCTAFEHRVQRRMAGMAQAAEGTLHVVLEHFSFEMQGTLDRFQRGELDLNGLLAEYAEGDEGHDLGPYSPLLAHAQDHAASVRLHGGFIPRRFARMLMREGVPAAVEAASARGFVSADERCDGTEAHYSFFESLLTGRDHLDSTSVPSDQFRRMFPAQVLKDAAMAHKVCDLARTAPAADSFLVLCGVGHMAYGHGVPERILAGMPEAPPRLASVYCRGPAHGLHLAPLAALAQQTCVAAADQAAGHLLGELFGRGAASPAATLCLAYDDSGHDCSAYCGASDADTPAGGVARDDSAGTRAAPADRGAA